MAGLTKEELRKQIRRFLEDENRGIHISIFAQACGLSTDSLRKVFISSERPLTEHIQRRVNIAYENWRSGYLCTMRKRKVGMYPDYRRTPEVPMLPTTRVVFKNGQFSIAAGLQNRHDYSQPTLEEQLNKRA